MPLMIFSQATIQTMLQFIVLWTSAISGLSITAKLNFPQIKLFRVCNFLIEFFEKQHIYVGKISNTNPK